MQRDGWFLVFIFVPVALVIAVLIADDLHERYDRLKGKVAAMQTGRR